MKVLHVIEIRGVGGAENLLLDFLPAQLAVGLKISCVVLYKPAYEEAARNFGVLLERNGVAVKFITFKTGQLIRTLLMLRNYLKLHEPAIIHVHLLIAELLLAFCSKTFLSIPVVTTTHGFSKNDSNFKVRLFIIKNLLNRFAFCFISDFMYDFYTKYDLLNSKSITQVIHNGHNFANSKQSASTDLNKHQVKLIMPGRLIKLKGHHYAIAAVKRLVQDYPAIELDIFGTGASEHVIREEIMEAGLENNIFLKGFNPDIKSILVNYDIVLVPSLYEPFGMVFLEAFAAKVPVVAFDLPAGNEIIKDGFNGLLAEPFSAESLAEKIARLIEDQTLRTSIAENAATILKEKFSIRKMVEQYTNFYQRIERERPSKFPF